MPKSKRPDAQKLTFKKSNAGSRYTYAYQGTQVLAVLFSDYRTGEIIMRTPTGEEFFTEANLRQIANHMKGLAKANARLNA
jgi:hypothetical protein